MLLEKPDLVWASFLPPASSRRLKLHDQVKLKFFHSVTHAVLFSSAAPNNCTTANKRFNPKQRFNVRGQLTNMVKHRRSFSIPECCLFQGPDHCKGLVLDYNAQGGHNP
ncbi:hypothetical protein J4Q44_G00244940 [Coregonus suidteri]|uniref:Uncharacterized protein n=1 Tax=Coregonus suidteri TaxID=861788 RepID=A0AAN8LB65_9TELE